MTDLTATLVSFKPELVTSYEAMVRSRFERVVAMHGPKLRGVVNCWTWAKVFREFLRPSLRLDGGVWSIDESRLALNAERYADAAIEAWRDKITAKMGELENARVVRMSGVSFQIVGERGGKRVVIEQQMIINVSSQGKPYNQFPARLYVDGKFVSEAAYKRLAA